MIMEDFIGFYIVFEYKAKKLPGFLEGVTSPLSPRNGKPCFPKNEMAQTICFRICLFCGTQLQLCILPIMSILMAIGLVIEAFSEY